MPNHDQLPPNWDDPNVRSQREETARKVLAQIPLREPQPFDVPLLKPNAN